MTKNRESWDKWQIETDEYGEISICTPPRKPKCTWYRKREIYVAACNHHLVHKGEKPGKVLKDTGGQVSRRKHEGRLQGGTGQYSGFCEGRHAARWRHQPWRERKPHPLQRTWLVPLLRFTLLQRERDEDCSDIRDKEERRVRAHPCSLLSPPFWPHTERSLLMAWHWPTNTWTTLA